MSRVLAEDFCLGHRLDDPAPFRLAARYGASSRSRCSGVRRCHSSPLYSAAKRSSSTPRSIQYDDSSGRSTSIWSSGGGNGCHGRANEAAVTDSPGDSARASASGANARSWTHAAHPAEPLDRPPQLVPSNTPRAEHRVQRGERPVAGSNRPRSQAVRSGVVTGTPRTSMTSCGSQKSLPAAR